MKIKGSLGGKTMSQKAAALPSKAGKTGGNKRGCPALSEWKERPLLYALPALYPLLLLALLLPLLLFAS